MFGPGIGECIVIHYGDEKWFIIDSCLCPETKQPIAKVYLESLGVNLAEQVTGILITHWHQDHTDGAFALLKACTSAKLYVTNALMSNEAFMLARLFQEDLFADSDEDIREFRNIIKYLFESKERDRLDPVKARHTFFDLRNNNNTRLVALSPSPTAVTQAIANLAARTPKAQSNRNRNVVKEDQNLNAVAVHFTFNEFSALLGSDLEDTGNKKTGWSAVFSSNIVSELSLPTSSVFKVSHHGSKNGHHDRIWDELLGKKPISVTTPFASHGLPKEDRITEIARLSEEFIVTRDPKANKKIRRDPMVDREMKATVNQRKIVNDKMGHIQVRIAENNNFTVAMNDQCVRFAEQ